MNKLLVRARFPLMKHHHAITGLYLKNNSYLGINYFVKVDSIKFTNQGYLINYI